MKTIIITTVLLLVAICPARNYRSGQAHMYWKWYDTSMRRYEYHYRRAKYFQDEAQENMRRAMFYERRR